MTHFRLRWQKRGEHVHVQVFVATRETTTHAQAGTLALTQAEWESFLRCFNDHGDDRVVVIPEDGQP